MPVKPETDIGGRLEKRRGRRLSLGLAALAFAGMAAGGCAGFWAEMDKTDPRDLHCDRRLAGETATEGGERAKRYKVSCPEWVERREELNEAMEAYRD